MTRDVRHRHDTAHVGPVPVEQLGTLTWKTAVRAATTANGTLGTAYENGDTIDGVVLATGDRILLKNQTTGANNGIYTVNASGAPTRAGDMDGSDEVKGAVVFVREGTVNAGTLWRNTNTGTVTIGTTALTFAALGASLFTLDGVRARLLTGLSAVSQTDTGTVADVQLGSTPGFVTINATNSVSIALVSATAKHYLDGGTGLVIPILSADPVGGDSEEAQLYFNDVSATIRWYDGAAWADVGGGGAPASHAASHEDGGADEIDVTGLVGAGAAFPSGTSNPGSPSNGDLFYRSDLDLLIRYRTTGTRWVCVCPHSMAEGPQVAFVPVAGSPFSIYLPTPAPITPAILIVEYTIGVYVNTTNDGSNYWTFGSITPAAGFSQNTSADAANSSLIKRQVVDYAWTVADGYSELQGSKTGAPGTTYHMVSYTYRYIVT